MGVSTRQTQCGLGLGLLRPCSLVIDRNRKTRKYRYFVWSVHTAARWDEIQNLGATFDVEIVLNDDTHLKGLAEVEKVTAVKETTGEVPVMPLEVVLIGQGPLETLTLGKEKVA